MSPTAMRLPIVTNAFILAISIAFSCVSGCKVKDPPPITSEWSDDFQRTSIGGNYYKTGGGHKLVDGTLSTKGSRNHPLWLRKKLPRDVVIEFDAWSNSPEGDIKVELFGDGVSYDPNGGQYTATGYVLIMGGWGNAKSMIARGNEHGKQLVEKRLKRADKVKVGQRYRWRIRREGNDITWWVDDMEAPYMTYKDSHPFQGKGHEYFGFNNWESDSYFDNLIVRAL